MSAIITISFTVGLGYTPGDTARLHGNAGSGAIDWNNPLNEEIFDLFPDGAGIYGYGRAPYGRHPYGHGYSLRTAGYGHLPYGRHPYGHGSAVIEAKVEVAACGAYLFGFKAQDAAGNAHQGTPEETEVPVHIAPAAPTGLKFVSYNKTTDVLTLDAA